MKVRMIVAATSAALFSLGAMAAGDDKQKQSQSQQPGAQQSQGATGASGSGTTGASGSMSTSGQSSKSAAGGASASQESQAQGGAQSSDLVKQVQQKLSQEGHQLQADGIMGPNTQAALKKYQEKNNLEPTGNLDKETLSSLGVSGDMGGGASAATGGSTSGPASGSTSGQDSSKSEKKQ